MGKGVFVCQSVCLCLRRGGTKRSEERTDMKGNLTNGKCGRVKEKMAQHPL